MRICIPTTLEYTHTYIYIQNIYKMIYQNFSFVDKSQFWFFSVQHYAYGLHRWLVVVCKQEMNITLHILYYICVRICVLCVGFFFHKFYCKLFTFRVLVVIQMFLRQSKCAFECTLLLYTYMCVICERACITYTWRRGFLFFFLIRYNNNIVFQALSLFALCMVVNISRSNHELF